MRSVGTRVEVSEIVRRWHEAGESLALVPTMGSLHEGHLQLVREARRRAERVAVSIFVNPAQFTDPGDFKSYPRALKEDRVLLVDSGVDMLFIPAVEEIYPHGLSARTLVQVPGLSDTLCGAFRPGHFTGVATVVAILFNIVRPDLALFGEKDYQQLLIIRRLVDDLRFPVKILGVGTVREKDGLALSSRNRYLNPAERGRAAGLYRCLCALRDEIVAGARDYAALEEAGMQRLTAAGFQPEYVSLRRAADLGAPAPDDKDLRLMAAAWLGNARLIDNLPLELPRMGPDQPPSARPP